MLRSTLRKMHPFLATAGVVDVLFVSLMLPSWNVVLLRVAAIMLGLVAYAVLTKEAAPTREVCTLLSLASEHQAMDDYEEDEDDLQESPRQSGFEWQPQGFGRIEPGCRRRPTPKVDEFATPMMKRSSKNFESEDEDVDEEDDDASPDTSPIHRLNGSATVRQLVDFDT
ncbi:hypothetical protein SPRG_09405 [Saprolegnia parasitica CBS 223.65]|uniref:Transmembrane protein n=1 Tax=Saprolegnia parasitica (strain CBS 223.65) TaxID=695850 RepID=A0A067CF63_SAPPC|nr:hypothetical protein SPRG_09405 [Saprolegnia parasitica CBS 223.65]KDO25462.1 hypothetical protein SPRG_09405 [Saprolegnia parasitica CBS 223.65]|eukprot:XP_012203887.1 hypothetical protein SPRG_09405 [Saprolegnia parasitica CBS 223.65]